MKLNRRDTIVRFLYGVLFLVVWLAIVYYLGFTQATYDSGSSIPIGEKIVPFNNHGYVVYITVMQDFLKELYGIGLAFFFVLYMLLGAILQLVFKVKIFGTTVPWLKSSKIDNARSQKSRS